MAWLEITINTASADMDQTVDTLTANGFYNLLIEDQAQFEDFLEQNRAYWDYIDEQLQQQIQGLSQIKLYLEDTDTAGLERLSALLTSLSLPMIIAPLEESDWEEGWKEGYNALEVGDRLVVLPYWLEGEDHGQRLPVILDPGLTFGTGAHPSTQMVMRAMETYVTPGSHCLDLGSGSGILSIAALRLGAESAIGVDIDPKAEDIARENAAYNHFATPAFTALTGNVTTDHKLMDTLASKQYSVVLVNIVADVIIGLAPVLPSFLGDDSILICSGILDTRLGDVLAALTQAGLTIVDTYQQEDWRCVTAKRRTL